LRRAVFGAAWAACGPLAIASGCSLGLDPSKIADGHPDASLPGLVDVAADAATAVDAAPAMDAPLDDSAADVASESGDVGPPGCTHDGDCVGIDACHAGKCDAATGACSFAVCPSALCQGSSCSAATSTCTTPAPYGFHSALVTVSAGPVGCGGNAAACIAAAYPFVFVGTANGVVAYSVYDPSSSSPAAVPIQGLPFLPQQMTAMGSRVYFVGPVVGSGPTYRIQVAWIDVPSDPLAQSLTATTTFDSLPVPSLQGAWATTDGSLFLVDLDQAQSFLASKVMAPFADGTALPFFASVAVPLGEQPVAVSGSRLVFSRWQETGSLYQTLFSFENGAGTSSAQNGGEQATYTALGATAPGNASYAQGADGSLLSGAAALVVNDAGELDIPAVKLAWLVASGTAPQFDGSASVDVETYAPPVSAGNPVVGPVAWVDANTALVLAAAKGTVGSGSAGQTSVQVASKTQPPILAGGRRYILPASVGLVGAASSGGFGYVLAVDPSSATTCTLHVFAPSCAGP
jgi:hypothetical protein